MDYPECAKWWITNKVCRNRSRQWEGLYSVFCTQRILPISKRLRINWSPDKDEKLPVSNNLNSNPNYQRSEVVGSNADILSIVCLSALHLHLVSGRLRININIHLLSFKDYNQIESPLSFKVTIRSSSHSQMRYVTWAAEVAVLPVCGRASRLMGNEGGRPFVLSLKEPVG